MSETKTVQMSEDAREISVAVVVPTEDFVRATQRALEQGTTLEEILKLAVHRVAAGRDFNSSGRAGGKARWANVSPEQRQAYGRRMAAARWGKKP